MCGGMGSAWPDFQTWLSLFMPHWAGVQGVSGQLSATAQLLSRKGWRGGGEVCPPLGKGLGAGVDGFRRP